MSEAYILSMYEKLDFLLDYARILFVVIRYSSIHQKGSYCGATGYLAVKLNKFIRNVVI